MKEKKSFVKKHRVLYSRLSSITEVEQTCWCYFADMRSV